MKNLLFALLFMFSTSLFAQYKINVEERGENIGGGSHNAFVVKIYENTAKDVLKAWKNELKKMGAKVSDKKELFGDDASMKAMGDNTFDVYAKANDVEEGVVELIVAVDLGGAYLASSQHPEQAKVFKDHLYAFAVNMTKAGIGNKLKEAEKELEKLQKEQEHLVKEKEKLQKNIEEWEKAIEQAKKDIEENEKNQEKKKEEIEAQKKVVQEIAAKEKAVK